ncbi:hypothetical protein KSF78_0003890 [Schistosoma japonicum]|nr:hypothetical protein KSF78_0003889 [Schistosoma japonicum]KAH8868092.1 hypothetical protein KSF78_0003890 [Schistosoma japonicum]
MLKLELARLGVARSDKEIEKNYAGRQKSNSYEAGIDLSTHLPNAISRILDFPNSEIIRFDGDPVHYWSVIRNFEKCVGNENIRYKAKLNSLIQYCGKEAKSIIRHCTLLEPEAAYRKVLVLLEEMFGQKHVVSHKFIDKILPVPSIRRNYSRELRKLSIEMQVCDLTLKQMDYISDLNSTRTIESMVLKLPTHIQLEWMKIACKIVKGGWKPLVSDSTNIDKEQANVANTRYGLLVNETAIK